MKDDQLWIKVYERDGGQVAFMLDHDEEGNPLIKHMTMVKGSIVILSMGFHNTDEGLKAREKVFSELDYEKAGVFMSIAKTVLSNQEGGDST